MVAMLYESVMRLGRFVQYLLADHIPEEIPLDHLLNLHDSVRFDSIMFIGYIYSRS